MTPEHLSEVFAGIVAVVKVGGSEGLKRAAGDGYEFVRDRFKQLIGKEDVPALTGNEGRPALTPESPRRAPKGPSASFPYSESNISYEAALGFLSTCESHGVPIAALPLKIRDTANRHIAALRGVRALPSESASSRALLNQAYGMLLNASSSQEYNQADALLSQVQDSETSYLLKAVILAERAQLKLIRLEYREAAADFQRASEWAAGNTELRADYLFSAATALRYHGDEKGEKASLSRALDLYREVLEIARRGFDRGKLAEFSNHYWNTLQTLGEREGGEDRVEEALSCNKEALSFYDRRREPLETALIKNNIGNALLVLGERDSGVSQLEKAVEAYDEAIDIYTRKGEPILRASVYNNRGVALQVLGERECRHKILHEQGIRHLKEAAVSVRRALKIFKREAAPLDWAMAQVSLSNALVALGEVEDSLPQIKKGLAGYESALEEYTEDDMDLHWAGTRNNCGRALHTLGEREDGTGYLIAAERAYREALRKNTRERAPLDWAMMKNNLGNVLQLMFDRRDGEGTTLVGAIEAYRDALKEFMPKRTPEQWSAVESNLEIALFKFAKGTTGTGLLSEGENSMRADRESLSEMGLARSLEAVGLILRDIPSEQSGHRLVITSRFWVLKGVPER